MYLKGDTHDIVY